MLARMRKKSFTNSKKTLDETTNIKYLLTIKLSTTTISNMTTVTMTGTGIYDYFEPKLPKRKGIHVYILDKKDQRIGVLAATVNDNIPDTVFIGWSLCNSSLGDRFDPKRGVEIAYERSRKCSAGPIPISLLERYEAFKFRCRKYFKDKQAFI